MKFQCCFHCSAHITSQKVDKLLEKNFTCEGAWLQARDRMLRPILRRMAEASQGYMPVRWTDARIPLPTYDLLLTEPNSAKRRIRVLFWRLCRIVRYSFEEYASGITQDILHTSETTPKETVIQSFHRMASSMKNLVLRDITQEPITPRTPETMHLSFQIGLINNEDIILDTVYYVVSHKLRISKVSNFKIHLFHSNQ